MSDNNYGVINEVGDMGLGFDPVSEEDNKKINESAQNEQKEKKEEE